ncbi:hypothetical protein ACWFNE_20340 [Cellulomonas sp. NPDC055163]
MSDTLEQLRAVRREQLRQSLAERDKLRAVRAASEAGITQNELARTLGVTQPAVAKMLARAAERVPAVREGFSSATPLEVAERYAAGLITREQMRAELSAWDYTSRERPDGPYDEIWVVDDHSFENVSTATREGYLDHEDYEVIFDAYGARVRAGELTGLTPRD